MAFLAVKRFDAIGALNKLAAFLCCNTRYTRLYKTQKKEMLTMAAAHTIFLLRSNSK
jgi:hypothetical protein